MKPLFRTLFVLSIVFTSFTATAQKLKTPMEMSDYLVSVTDSLYSQGKAWGAKFNKVYSSKAFGELESYRLKLETFIQRKRLELVALKDIGGSEKFRLAMIDFLAYEQRMVQEAFLPIEKLSSSSTDEQIKKAIDNLTTLAANEEEHLEKVTEAQLEYAQKNGFKIEDEKKGDDK